MVVHPSLTPVLPISMFSPFLKGQPPTLTTWCQPWTLLPWPTFQPAASPQSCTSAWLWAYCLGGICRKQHSQVLSFQSRGTPRTRGWQGFLDSWIKGQLAPAGGLARPCGDSAMVGGWGQSQPAGGRGGEQALGVLYWAQDSCRSHAVTWSRPPPTTDPSVRLHQSVLVTDTAWFCPSPSLSQGQQSHPSAMLLKCK